MSKTYFIKYHILEQLQVEQDIKCSFVYILKVESNQFCIMFLMPTEIITFQNKFNGKYNIEVLKTLYRGDLLSFYKAMSLSITT